MRINKMQAKYSSTQQVESLKKDLLKLKELISKYPTVHLKPRKHRNGYQFRLYYDKSCETGWHEEYLSVKDSLRLSTYGKKYYYEQLVKVLEKEIKVLQSIPPDFGSDNKGRVYDELPEVLKDTVKPIYQSIKYKNNQWYISDYKHNPYTYDEGTVYETVLGERVRSRAECIIANTLSQYELMYHYEEQLVLENGKVKYPDFTIVHPVTGEFFYLEFFGMMDDPDYAANCMKKIKEYSESKYCRNMIYIFDHKLAQFSTKSLTKNIERCFFS